MTEEVKDLTIEETLLEIQEKLKVTKDKRNEHGNFNFRSMEDINQALKPILLEYRATLIVKDDIVKIGDRYYVKATATLFCNGEDISATAFAREAEEQRGMNSAQLTGSTSSYARKYACNGLFAIDDNKDADEYMTEEQIAEQDRANQQNAVDGLRKLILTLPVDKQDEALESVLKSANIDSIEKITYREAKIQYSAITKRYELNKKETK